MNVFELLGWIALAVAALALVGWGSFWFCALLILLIGRFGIYAETCRRQDEIDGITKTTNKNMETFKKILGALLVIAFIVIAVVSLAGCVPDELEARPRPPGVRTKTVQLTENLCELPAK